MNHIPTQQTLSSWPCILLMVACGTGGQQSQPDAGQPAQQQVRADAGTVDGGETDGGQTTMGPSFAQDVVPIFQSHCVRCHHNGAGFFDLRAQFAYASLTSVTPGISCAEDGVLVHLDVVAAGNPDQSLLWRKIADSALTTACGREMPPTGNGPLLTIAPAQAETIRQWIVDGALNN